MGLGEEVVGRLRAWVEGASAEGIRDRMAELCDREGAIDLRLGEYLVMLFDQFDLRKLDYARPSAFITEELDMDRTWVGRIVALARSDLLAVKVALCRNVIPISTAVLAVKDVTRADEMDWITGVVSGDIRPRKKAPSPRVDIDDPEKAAFVDRVFRKARTVIGVPCADSTVERHILRAWRARTSGKQLIREATAPREPPPKVAHVWDPLEDPAAPYLGPRVIPTDEHQLLALIKALLEERRMRRMELGILYRQVVERQLYAELAFDSAREMVRECLSVSVRSLEDYANEAEWLTYYPELEEALGDGMDVSRVSAVSGIATEDNVARWLAVAKRVGVTELRRAVGWAAESTSAYVLGLYERAIQETQDAHTWVALKAAKTRTPRPPRRIEGVHPDLYEACVWYDAEVQLPNPKGFPSVRVREGFVCENPLCNCMTLRGDGHHRKPRKDGGTNHEGNAGHLCEPCHQRGVHNGGFRWERDAKGRDLWTFPTGRRVMVF